MDDINLIIRAQGNASLLYESGYNKGFKDGIKGSILKDDYEARLKADMVAMLDKIRAEIINAVFDSQEIDGEHESLMIIDLNDALNIIDKYKAESEE